MQHLYSDRRSIRRCEQGVGRTVRCGRVLVDVEGKFWVLTFQDSHLSQLRGPYGPHLEGGGTNICPMMWAHLFDFVRGEGGGYYVTPCKETPIGPRGGGASRDASFGRKHCVAFWYPLHPAVLKSAVVLPKWVDSTAVFRSAFYPSELWR